MAVCLLSACGGSGDLDKVAFELASALNENDPDRLDQFRLTEAAAEEYLDALLKEKPALKALVNFDEFWEELGNKELEWDIPKKVVWEYFTYRINDGVKVNTDDLEYEVVKDKENPYRMVMYIETEHEEWKWLVCKFVNFDGGYFIDDLAFLDISRGKVPAQEVFDESLNF